MDTAALVKRIVKEGDNPEFLEQIQHEIMDDIAAGSYGSDITENIQLLHAIMESGLESNKMHQTSQDIIHKICLPLLHKMFLLLSVYTIKRLLYKFCHNKTKGVYRGCARLHESGYQLLCFKINVGGIFLKMMNIG